MAGAGARPTDEFESPDEALGEHSEQWTDIYHDVRQALADGGIFVHELRAVFAAEIRISRIAYVRAAGFGLLGATSLIASVLFASAGLAYLLAIELGFGWLLALALITALHLIGVCVFSMVAMNYLHLTGFSRTRALITTNSAPDFAAARAEAQP